MARRVPTRMYVAGVIERHDNHLLIARPAEGEDAPRLWQFPRCATKVGDLPEAVMRRFAKRALGISVEIVSGQPPLVEGIEGVRAELRYFFCGLVGGEASTGPYAEVRWISKLHLREYEFDPPSQIVVDWLLNS